MCSSDLFSASGCRVESGEFRRVSGRTTLVIKPSPPATCAAIWARSIESGVRNPMNLVAATTTAKSTGRINRRSNPTVYRIEPSERMALERVGGKLTPRSTLPELAGLRNANQGYTRGEQEDRARLGNGVVDVDAVADIGDPPPGSHRGRDSEA